jgi:hypothetical protein
MGLLRGGGKPGIGVHHVPLPDEFLDAGEIL